MIVADLNFGTMSAQMNERSIDTFSYILAFCILPFA